MKTVTPPGPIRRLLSQQGRIALGILCAMLVLISCETPGISEEAETRVAVLSQAASQAHHISARQVVDAFVTAGLEVGETKVDDPFYWDLGPDFSAISYINFFVPSLGQGAGGIVLEFDGIPSRDVVFNEYEARGFYEGGAFWPYVSRQANVLLQINGILGQDLADKYIDVLQQLALEAGP